MLACWCLDKRSPRYLDPATHLWRIACCTEIKRIPYRWLPGFWIVNLQPFSYTIFFPDIVVVIQHVGRSVQRADDFDLFRRDTKAKMQSIRGVLDIVETLTAPMENTSYACLVRTGMQQYLITFSRVLIPYLCWHLCTERYTQQSIESAKLIDCLLLIFLPPTILEQCWAQVLSVVSRGYYYSS